MRKRTDGDPLDGRLEMSMAAVYPYAQLTTAKGTEVWALLGTGSGEATNHRQGKDREASGASLGDSSSLTPFAQLSGRFDQGDDVTGAGLEVAGGLRLGTSRFQVEIQGRTLALHEESGYREEGASMTARLNPATDGSGLSLTLGPTWGAANGADSLWRDEMPKGNLAVFDGAGVQAGIGYGFAFDRFRAVLTPLAEFRIAQGTSMHLGARFAPAGRLDPFAAGTAARSARTFELQLGLERRESNDTEPEHRLSVEYRMRF